MASNDGWEEVPLSDGWEEVPLTRAAAPKKMGRAEGLLHGSLDTIPFGQRVVANVSTGLLKTLKDAGDMGIGPGYWKNIADTSTDEQIGAERARLTKAEKDQPGWTTGGKVLGGGLSMAAMSPIKAAEGISAMSPALGLLTRTGAAAANAGIYGAAHGAGRADTLDEALSNAATEGPITAAVGAGGHLVGEAVGPAASYLGDKAKDLAGWLKVNSIHPTPSLGKEMARIPGGTVGVGRELLRRGVGGLTKAGTSRQTDAAMEQAGGVMGDIAKTYDAGGGAQLDLTPTLRAVELQAQKLQAEPTTVDAGNKLLKLVQDYQALNTRPSTAVEALSMKRALGKAAYKQGLASKAGDAIAGDYGAGMAKFERAVDDKLDTTLGPSFGEANDSFRRMLYASRAAETQAAIGQANHLIPLVAGMAGFGGAAMGHGAQSIPAAAASLLLSKYGSQAGARTLYTIGQVLESTPEIGAAVASRAPGVDGHLAALIAALRERAPAQSPSLPLEASR